eukprot:Rmarinus@m.25912
MSFFLSLLSSSWICWETYFLRWFANDQGDNYADEEDSVFQDLRTHQYFPMAWNARHSSCECLVCAILLICFVELPRCPFEVVSWGIVEFGLVTSCICGFLVCLC